METVSSVATLVRLVQSRRARSNDLDDEIASQAKRRMLASSYREIREIDCECFDGLLILRGRLSSFFLLQTAQESVRDLAKVNAVLNQVEVVWLARG